MTKEEMLELEPEDILEYNGYDIDELGSNETILFRNPDFVTAIVGVSDNDRVIYDYEKMIEYLVITEDMTEEDAADFIGYNTIRALPYIDGNAPIIMYPLMFK